MKTTITAIALTLITLASFAGNNNTSKDQDVAAILSSMGISTSVDAAALEAQYPSVQLTITESLNVTFSNPNNASYTLFVYDVDGNILSNTTNITTNNVSVDFSANAHTYQLRGEGNIYCGKF